ncbi:hypothetical protein CDL15_Pgr026601 [Punica granatum]|uniref:Uncharacterized protein n=1 Tax=Punica granatum TaxID=22663 RepID=A0A218WND9_PUNGR|nr:hypothetical protein CDL15_Pgr026601 [Punica granatum]
MALRSVSKVVLTTPLEVAKALLLLLFVSNGALSYPLMEQPPAPQRGHDFSTTNQICYGKGRQPSFPRSSMRINRGSTTPK